MRRPYVGSYRGFRLTVADSGFIKVGDLPGIHYDVAQAKEWIDRYLRKEGQ